LVRRGLIHPTLSRTYSMDEVGQAAYEVHHNRHQGKVGVLTLSPEPGLGVTNPARREALEPEINRFRNQ
jgi:crotonyl-CoA reductase